MHMLESYARRLAVALLAGRFEKEPMLQRAMPRRMWERLLS